MAPAAITDARHTDVRFNARHASQSSSPISLSGDRTGDPPALLTQTCKPPNASVAASAKAAKAVRSVTSVATAMASDPVAVISEATRSMRSWCRAATTTDAPAAPARCGGASRTEPGSTRDEFSVRGVVVSCDSSWSSLWKNRRTTAVMMPPTIRPMIADTPVLKIHAKAPLEMFSSMSWTGP